MYQIPRHSGRPTRDHTIVLTHARIIIDKRRANAKGEFTLQVELAHMGIANGDSRVAVNNNTGNIYSSENEALKDRISLLERIIEEKERLITILMKEK